MKKNNNMEYEVNKGILEDSSFIEEIQDLQKANEFLQTKIKNERLLWIIVVLLLTDLMFFKDMQTWGAPLVIGILEILIVLFAAHHWGLQQIISLWKDVLNTFNKNTMD